MAVATGGAVKSIQKVNTTLGSQLGSTLITLAMPNFQLTDPANSYVEDVWWRLASGALPASGLIAVFADVTGVNQVTILVNTLVAFTASLQVGGRIVEYG
jgi:hypothetical protein